MKEIKIQPADKKEPWCCHIGCPLDAMWEIYFGDSPGPNDWIHSCDDHIGDLLTDARIFTLVSLRPG